MKYKHLFDKPVHNSKGKQPWYIKWSEGTEYSLIINTYVDAIFIGSLFGIFMSLIFPIMTSSIYVLIITTSPIPLSIFSAMYYKYIYHYKSSASTYGLKPSFRFIFIYQLIINILFVLIYIIL